MKKILLLSCSILFYTQIVFAKKIVVPKENVCIHKGNITMTFGYGTPSLIRQYVKYKSNKDEVTVKGVGPFIFKGEYMLSNTFGLGFNSSFSKSKVFWYDVGYDTIQNIYRKFEFGIKAYEVSGTIRLNYHFWKRKKIDSYAGLGAGYGMIHMASYTLAHTTKFSIVYNFPPPVSLECTWGLRYFPLKNLGLYTEVGLGKSWILFDKYFIPDALFQAGICLKL